MTRRRRAGVPYGLTPRKRETFITALKAGNRLSVAARYAGLNPRTVEEWMRRGQGTDRDRPSSPFFVALWEEVEAAKAHAEVFAMAQVRQGMGREPRMAAWWLENTSPDWRRRSEPPPVQTNVQVSAPTQVIVVDRELLEEMGIERVRALREVKQVGDGGSNGVHAERRSRLVEDSASTVDG